ncbi:T30E16.14 [Arabidopsis thaliana]|uniref:T30E16.14 n=1 Tax=Arabidopsis thaliana TaxID=3702 RepID=Q9LQ57_ARATH|nr:T30E16.14 [Arabidopsis thaliana]
MEKCRTALIIETIDVKKKSRAKEIKILEDQVKSSRRLIGPKSATRHTTCLVFNFPFYLSIFSFRIQGMSHEMMYSL